MSNAPMQAQRPRLESFDDSADRTGPSTPYHPEGDSRADLHAGPSSMEGDHLPKSGYRVTPRFSRTLLAAVAVAYVAGVASAAIAFLALR